MTAQQLRRLEPARRHPLLLVLLQALAIERGDELLDQFDKLLRLTDGRARRRVEEQRRKTARQRDELAALARQLSMILLECAATGELPMERVRGEVGLERLHAAAAIEPGELPPIDEQQLDKVRGSYNHLRPAMHAVLDTVALRGATSVDEGAARHAEAAASGARPVRRRASRASSQGLARVGAGRRRARAAHPL